MPRSVAISYHVRDDADVTVRARIGDGQAGGHSIFVGPDLVTQGEIEVAANLGSGQGLKGRVLVVSSVAVDVMPSTDHVSVEVTLTGGHPDPMPVVQAADVQPSGAESFITIVSFV